MDLASQVDPTLEQVRAAVDVAAGRRPADLHVRGGRLLDVFTGTVRPADVWIAGPLVAAVAAPDRTPRPEAAEVVDVTGAWLAPGLIDGHVHVESSLVTPAAYAGVVLPRGVVGVVTDPHEIANVAGAAGVRWWSAFAEHVPFDVWSTVPSCVPSTTLETAGAELGLAEIAALLGDPRVVGVAELMSFHEMIAGEDEQLAKVMLAAGARRSAEGHAPGVTGADLQAYFAAGVASDHESTSLEEGREKLAAGVFLMIREGSVTRDLDALLPLVDPRHADRIGFVTDDRLPHDLLHEGGVDVLVRRSIAAGVDPVYAVRCASWNVARHFGLRRRGAIAPGYLADLAVVADLSSFTVDRVLRHGHWVAGGGRLTEDAANRLAAATHVLSGLPGAERLRHTVRLPHWSPERLRLPAPAPGGRVRVVRPIPGQVVTEALELEPTVVGDESVADPSRDLLKLVCVHRHGRGDGVGVGLVTGFGLRRGALASSVGHDHHNLMLVGADDAALYRVALRTAALGGGLVVDDGSRIVAEVPLPIGGLVSDAAVADVVSGLDAAADAVRSLGGSGADAFMTLSFLGLAVIPALRLTDHGLVDVADARLVPFLT